MVADENAIAPRLGADFRVRRAENALGNKGEISRRVDIGFQIL